MDQLKNLAGKLGNSSNSNNAATGTQGGNPVAGGSTTGTGNAGTEDYGDKALDFAEKKFGYNGNRETNEKITDGIRGQYEKATGSKVPDKFSN